MTDHAVSSHPGGRAGADELRARIRELLERERRVVRMGGHQIEVVEVAVLEELLRES